MKNRLALLSVLLVAGLLIAGAGAAIGAGNILEVSPITAKMTKVETGLHATTYKCNCTGTNHTNCNCTKELVVKKRSRSARQHYCS